MPFKHGGPTDDPDHLIEQMKEEQAFCPGCGEPGRPHPNCECVKPENHE